MQTRLERILFDIEHTEFHNYRLMELMMAKFDELNAKLDALKTAVDALPEPAPPEDDTADVTALEDKVDAIAADVASKTSTPTSPTT